MGNRPSISDGFDDDDDDDFGDDGFLCFSFCPVPNSSSLSSRRGQKRRTRRKRRNQSDKNDPLGTPLPGTPLHILMKRKMYEEAAMSSKYSGLEKEIPGGVGGPHSFGNASHKQVHSVSPSSTMAQIYEGNVRTTLPLSLSLSVCVFHCVVSWFCFKCLCVCVCVHVCSCVFGGASVSSFVRILMPEHAFALADTVCFTTLSH